MRIIAGTARSMRIDAPEGKDTRPTLDRVRENLFNILSRRIMDARVLDLFAGSGALSFEAISRGAAHATLVDMDRKAVAVIKQNAARLHMEQQTQIINAAWQNALSRISGETFDLLFLDPPYAMADLSEVTEKLLPFMKRDSLIIIEHPSKSQPLVCEGLLQTDTRAWGYCGVTMYQKTEEQI